MSDNILVLVASILNSLIVVLRQSAVPAPVLDSISILAVVLFEGDEVLDELQRLKAQVEAMAEAKREPNVAELDALQDRADRAIGAIRRLAKERVALPADPE